MHLSSPGYSEIVKLWSPGLRRRTISLLLRRNEHSLTIHAASVFLDNGRNFPSRPNIRVSANTFEAVRLTEAFSEEEIVSYLDGLEKRPLEISLGTETYQLPSADSAPQRFYSPLYEPNLAGPLRLPSLTITGSRLNHEQALDTSLNNISLFVSDPPFTGIQDLVSELGLPMDALQHGWTPNIKHTTAAPVLIKNDARFFGDQLSFSVIYPKDFIPEKMKLRLISFSRSTAPTREVIHTTPRVEPATDNENEASYTLSVKGKISARVLLSYSGEHLADFYFLHETQRPNLIAEAHQYFHGQKDLGRILERLNRDGANLFETVVSTTLSQLGLRTLFYGGVKEFSDGPDILALTDRSDFLLIEATIGHPNSNGKLMELANRCRALQSYIKDNELPARSVRGLMFSSLSAHQIDSARAEATDLGISLFCREELMEIQKFSAMNPNITGDLIIQILFDQKLAKKNASMAQGQQV